MNLSIMMSQQPIKKQANQLLYLAITVHKF